MPKIKSPKQHLYCLEAGVELPRQLMCGKGQYSLS